MKILIIAMTALILSSCSSVHYNRADVLDRQNNIKTLQQRLDAATEANVDILAPESFQKAADHLRDAYKEAQKINDRNAGDKTAEEGLALLEKAESIANRSRSVLTEALEKRSQAKAAEAHLAFKSEFVNLDRELKQAGKAIEAGKKIEGLKENASLASSYAALELRALKVTVSDKAERAYENALKSNAQRLAPLTMKDAKNELDVARKIIDLEKDNYEKAEYHAERARYLATRARYIAEILTGFIKEKLTQEQVVLWYQDQLRDIHASLPTEIPFDRANRDVVSGFAAELRTHGSQLAEQSSDLERLKREVQKPKKVDTFDELGSIFDEKEAEVLKRDNDIIIRSYGFQFPVGKAELVPGNFTLLNKIVSVIKKFPKARIEVEGHTDATGSNDLNLRLSNQRSQNIADFLVKVAGIEQDRVSHVGLGKEKPLASNATPEGRAKNRRIEVIIKR